MAPRKIAVLALAVVLLLSLAVGIAILVPRSEEIPYSSPTAVRTNEVYMWAHAPATRFPEIGPEVFEQISVEKTEGSIRIRYSTGEVPPWHAHSGTIMTHKAEGAEPIEIGEGSIRLGYIGVGTELPAGLPEHSPPSLRANYFTPDLKPVAHDAPELKLPPHERNLTGRSLPTAQFVFSCSNTAEFIWSRFHVFDARTQYPLYSASTLRKERSNQVAFNTPLTLWHQTPLELVGTLAMGPARIYSMPSTEGAELKLPDAAIKLLAISQGGFQELHALPGMTPGVVIFTNAPAHLPEEGSRPEFTIFIYCWPRASVEPREFEFYDQEGKQMPVEFNAVSGRILVRTIAGSPESLKEVRVKHYPSLHRLIFTIPELPGLPEENRNLENLFDVRVSYFRGTPRSLPEDLGKLVQMKTVGISPSLRAGSLPTDLTNITAHALFEAAKAGLPSKSDRLEVDSEKHQIRGQSSRYRAVVNTVKRLFGRRNDG